MDLSSPNQLELTVNGGTIAWCTKKKTVIQSWQLQVTKQDDIWKDLYTKILPVKQFDLVGNIRTGFLSSVSDLNQ